MPGGLGGIGSIASLASSAGGGKGGGGGGGSFTPPVNPALAAQQVGAQYTDYGMYNSTPRLVDQMGVVNMAGLTNAQAQQNFNLQNQQLQNAAQTVAGQNAALQPGASQESGTQSSDPANLGNTGGSLGD